MVSMTTEPVRTYNKIYDHGLGVVLLTLHAMMYVLSGISMAYGAYVFFTDMSFWRPVLLTILAVSFFPRLLLYAFRYTIREYFPGYLEYVKQFKKIRSRDQ